jgi:hypothetical protein
MAMIEGHDYVTVLRWDCPHCHKHNDGAVRIGRYPMGKYLLCQGCGVETYPALAENVKYKD